MKYRSNHLKKFTRLTFTFVVLSCVLLAGSYSFNFAPVSASPQTAKAGMLHTTLAKLTGFFQQGSEPEQEPNDTPGQANATALTSRRTGTVKYGDAAGYTFKYNNGPTDGIEDFFVVTVPGPDPVRVDIKLTFDNPAADLDLFLFKRSGNTLTPLAVSNGSTTTEQISPVPELAPNPKGAPVAEYCIGVSAFDDPGNPVLANYTLTLTTNAVQPSPTISRIVPETGNVGSAPLSLVVKGTNFFDGQSVVWWGDKPRTTVFLSNTELVAFINPTDMTTAKTVSVKVANPPSLGGDSNLVPFTISDSTVPPEVEPNELSGSATLLLAPGKLRGSVSVGDAAAITIRTSSGISDPIEDLFAVNLSTGARLNLDLVGSQSNANLALYLMKETGTSGEFTMIEDSRLSGPLQHLSPPSLLTPGRYLVGVSAVTGSSNYTLEARVPGDRLLQVVSSSAAPNSTAIVPIYFYSEGNENTLSFSLLFNPSLLGNPDITLGADAALAQLTLDKSLVAQGRIGVEVKLPVNQKFGLGAREISRIRFNVTPSSSTGAALLDFTDSPIVRSIADANGNKVNGSYQAGNIIITPGFEADVSPRPLGTGNGSVTIADWTQVGRFVTGLDAPQDGSEFQRADCAPKDSVGDGRLTIADWVMAGRYAGGLETITASGGPTMFSFAGTFEKAVPTEFFSQLIALEPEQGRSVRVVPATFNRGQDNTLSIELAAQGNENAIGFSLAYDATQLSFVRASLGADAAGAILNVNQAQLNLGRVGIGIALPSGQSFASGARQILTVTFSVPQSSSVNTTTISFGDQPIAREVVDATANVLQTNYLPDVVTLNPQISGTPSLSSVSPNTVLVGAPSFVLTLNGNNFIGGAVAKVAVNGGPAVERVTEFVNPTQLRVTIPAQDILETGSFTVSVQNPPPSGGTSGALTVNIINPAPTIVSISPSSAATGSPAFTLVVNGTNFVPGATVQWNGANRLTTYVSSTQLTAQIPGSDLTTAGTKTVGVTNPAPGGGASNTVNFTVAQPNPIPRIANISPTSVDANTSFTLTVNGSSFVQGSVVRVNGSALTTTFVSSTQLTAQVTGADIPNPGTASITVLNPTPGGGTSNAALLTLNKPPNPVPAITAISPDTVTSGSGQFVLTVTGTNFVSDSVIRFNGGSRETTFVSNTTLRTVIPAADILNGGTATITVFNPPPAGGVSNAVTLTINFAPPTISLLSPNSTVAGGSAFQLNVTGTNFAPGSVVRWNGQDRVTAFISVTELSAQITAADIANIGTASVTVFSPPPGGGVSNAVTFEIKQADRPVPRITTITPSEAQAGTNGLTITVNGANFVADSVVRWNGSPRATNFVNSTQLTAQITAADLATAGTASVTVFTPPAGGGSSNPVTFTINLPPNPVPKPVTLDPSTVGAGTGAFVLTVNGSDFVSSSVVRFNGAARPTTFVSANQLKAQIAAEDIPAAGTAAITVFTPTPGGGTSGELTLTIINPVPAITAINPSNVAVGSPGFTLTVTGTGFVVGSQIQINGTQRITTFVNNTTLTTQVSNTDVANMGSLTVQVVNPSPGGGGSNTVSLTIRDRNPVPRLMALSPDTVLAGGPGFTLVVNGSNFVRESVVRINGQDRATDFVSDTALAVQIPQADIANGGTLTVQVFNPTPGGGTSNPLTLNINNPTPRITSISPDAAAAGSAGFTLVVSGVNFVSSSVIRFNGIDLPTTFVTSSQLTAVVPAGAVATGAAAPVVVVNPAPGGGTSNAATFTITNPAPGISGISPTTVLAAGPAFTLTVTGTGFVPGSVVRFNGEDRPTSYVNPTQLTAAISGADIQNGGTAAITVVNPAPGGGVSNATSLAINNPAPVLSALNPNTIAAGSNGFTLGIVGTGFVPTSVVQYNGTARQTTFVSSSMLTIQVSTADLASASNVTITVVTPAPGGGTSNGLTFVISSLPNPTPSISSLTPNAKPSGSAAFALTVNGANFVPGAEVRWNGSPRPTTFNSATQLTAQISASDVASAGPVVVTVFNPAPGGGLSNGANFTITPPNPVPVLTSLTPSSIAVGSPAFTLTVNGTGFVPGAEVRVNGSARQTVFFSATQLFAQIPAEDVANIGSVQITVFNPTPGGGTSGALTLSIVQQVNPVPTVTAISPTSVSAGDPAFTLSVFGTDFVPAAVVQFNGSARQTVYVNGGELRAQISDTDIANAGTAVITVFNPGPGGGTSNAVNFLINQSGSGCRTICFQSAQYYLLNLSALPNGSVLIGGVNNNVPISIQQNLADIQRALQNSSGGLAFLNQQYLSAQISLAAADGAVGSPGVLNSSLRCYSLNFTVVSLSNGIRITPNTTLGNLLTQARLAILESRLEDMNKLGQVLLQLNGNSPTSRCR